MNIHILDENRINLLKALNEIPLIKSFYMAGGTALSLVNGYRESYDFDFFTQNAFDTDELLFVIQKKLNNYEIEVIQNKTHNSTLDLMINGIQVSFFLYEYPLIDGLIYLNEFPNIGLASIKDILCMKANGIAQRGSKKDFFDFYCAVKQLGLKQDELIDLLNQKFNDKNFIVSFAISLSYFEDAENEILSKTFLKYSWADIKSFFKTYASTLFEKVKK